MGDGHLEEVERTADLLGGIPDNALVGLMGHDEGNIVKRQARALKRHVHGGGQRPDGEFEHFLSVHPQHLARLAISDMGADAKLFVHGVEGVIVLFGTQTDAFVVKGHGGVVRGGAGEGVCGIVLIRDEAAEDPRPLLVPFHHGRSRAVPEQDAGVAVGPVRDAGQALRPHDERASDRVAPACACSVWGASGHQGLRHRQAVDEPGARGVQVESGRALQPQPPAQKPGTGGDHGVGRDGCVYDEVDLCRIDAALGVASFVPAQCLTGGGHAQIRPRLRNGHAAAFDARARDYPFVACVHELG